MSRHEDDAWQGSRPALRQFAVECATIHVRESEIADDDVVGAPLEKAKRLRGAARGHDLVVVRPEHHGHGVPDHFVVLYHEDPAPPPDPAHRGRAKVVKNKVAAPFKVVEFDMINNEGISPISEILNLGEKYDIIKKSGSTYSYGDTKLGVGYEKARIYLKENPKTIDEISQKIKEAMKVAAAAS